MRLWGEGGRDVVRKRVRVQDASAISAYGGSYSN